VHERLTALLNVLGISETEKAVFIKGKLNYYYNARTTYRYYYEELVGVFDEDGKPVPYIVLKGKTTAKDKIREIYWETTFGRRGFLSVFGSVEFEIVVPEKLGKQKLVIAKYTSKGLESKREYGIDDLRRSASYYGFELRTGYYDFKLNSIDYAASLLMKLIEYFADESSLNKRELYCKLAHELSMRCRKQ